MSTPAAPDLTKDQQRFDRLLRARIRAANIAAWGRAGGIQVVWLVILVAGAAVPFAEALIDDGWTWVSPTLGFVVVIAAGVERIFSRTTDAAVALDELRRTLAREHRLLLAGSDVYGADDDPYVLFAQRAEEHIARYDQQMVAHHRDLLRRTA